MLYEEKIIETIPVGPLGLIPLKGISELGEKVDRYLVEWRRAQIDHRIFRLPERVLYH